MEAASFFVDFSPQKRYSGQQEIAPENNYCISINLRSQIFTLYLCRLNLKKNNAN